MESENEYWLNDATFHFSLLMNQYLCLWGGSKCTEMALDTEVFRITI